MREEGQRGHPSLRCPKRPLLPLPKTPPPPPLLLSSSSHRNTNQKNEKVYLPWAARTGLRCADLMCVRYERHFDEPLEDLRRRLRIAPAPPPPVRLAPKRAAQAQP